MQDHRFLFERRVHRFISADNDQKIKESMELGLEALRKRQPRIDPDNEGTKP